MNELTSRRARRASYSASSISAICYPKTGSARAVRRQQRRRDVLSARARHRRRRQPNKRSKAQVVTFTNGTVAHEYQHLINASRRMYVNGVGPNFEEKWLDEGLAHIAEELNFFRVAGLGAANEPRRDGDSPIRRFTTAYSDLRDQQFPPLRAVPRRDGDAVADRFRSRSTTICRRAARSGTSCATRPTICRPARRTRSGSTS